MIILLFIAFACGGLILGCLIQQNSIDVLVKQEYQVEEAPAFLQDKKIVQLSDLHNHSVFYGEDNLATRVRNVDPDYLFLTGDFIDANTTSLDAYDWLFSLVNEIPTYYIRGNHEYKSSASALTSAFEEAFVLQGGINLTGQNVELSPGVYLSGVPDNEVLINPQDDDAYYDLIKEQLQDIPKEDYLIVLSHRPNSFIDYVNLGANLIFSGHTHGGQINLGLLSNLLFRIINPFEPLYLGGVFYYQNAVMINSRGLGQGSFRLRYAVNNEYWVITFA